MRTASGLLLVTLATACTGVITGDPGGGGGGGGPDAGPFDRPDAGQPGGPDAGPASVARMVRKVLVVYYDPSNPAAPGEVLSDTVGVVRAGQVPAESERIATGIREATEGHVDFQIVDTVRVNEFPRKLDGFRYTWSSFAACRANPSTCHQPDDFAYVDLMRQDTGSDLCTQIESGAVDEIWVWGQGYFGWDEFAYKIPGDADSFDTVPYNAWIYDLRRKDLPECGRPYFVMGFNMDSPGGNAIHSFGHRVESAITSSAPARGRWGECDGSSEWTDFTCLDKHATGVAGCGNVHYPPNATSDYDYGSMSQVASRCDDWATYPTAASATTMVDAATWAPGGGDTQWSYMKWWLGHLPRAEGTHVAGGVTVKNDWWHYILCYDRDCAITPP